MRPSLWKYSATVACLLAAMSVGAQAQVCGDANGDGTVTVTDGVQALRKAADLSSSCGNTCDVDRSGTVTVTDGVNILRKAADLPSTENCVGVDTQLQGLVSTTLLTFGSLTKIGTGAQAAEAIACDNPGGEFSIDQATGELTFSDCQLGGISFEGTFGISGNTVSFDITFTSLATEEDFSFLGDLTTQQRGNNSVLSGSLQISSSDLGDVDLTFEDIVSDPAGSLIGGALLFDASGSDIDGVVSIRVGFEASTVVPVSVIFDDQSTRNFRFDTVSGELTPVSN